MPEAISASGDGGPGGNADGSSGASSSGGIGDSGAAGDGSTPPSEAGTIDGSVIDAACGLKCGVYVSNAGNDANSGLPDAPLRTIGHAIDVARSAGAPSVFIAAGHYPEALKLSEGISLLGGYQCDALPCDWTSRDLTRDTAIVDADFAGVVADSTITRATTLEGLRIQGHPGALDGPLAGTVGAGAVALTLAGGSPTIVSCHIEGASSVTGGTGLQRRSIGVLVSGPTSNTQGPLIKGCTITAGQAADSSIGVLIEDATAGANDANVTLAQNTITAGSAALSVGVAASASGSTTVLEGDVIEAGTSTGAPATGGGTNVGSWGVVVSSQMKIHASYINASNAKSTSSLCPGVADFCGGVLSSGATLTLTSNVIGGVGASRSCAVLLTSGARSPGPVVIDSNALDPGGIGDPAGTSAAIALRNSGPSGVTSYATVRNNILLGGVNGARGGVYEDMGAKAVHLGVLDNNDFFVAKPTTTNDFAYRWWDPSAGGTNYSVDNLRYIPAPVPDGNIGEDPRFDTAAAKPYHLSKDSPCIDNGVFVGGQTPTLDIDGDPRPTPGTAPDIGADETNF